MRQVRLAGLIGGALAFAGACGSPEPAPPATGPAASAPSPSPAPAAAPVQIEMKNVRLRVDDGVVLQVRALRGEMVPRTPGEPPAFDEPRSYVLRIFHGDVTMDAASLAALMNHHVFNYEDAPLKDITVEFDDGRLKQKGKLKKGIWLPFSMRATASATADGRLRLHTDSVSALGIPATKLLDLFGLELDDLMDIERRRGVAIQDDDVIITPGLLLPPPEMRGHLANVEVTASGLRQRFATPGTRPPPLSPPDPAAANYVYFSGASVRFGKLTMTGADLQLIDADPTDPFDFYPAHYDRQLVAGYSKNTPAKGLKTYMPDFADVTARTDLRPATSPGKLDLPIE